MTDIEVIRLEQDLLRPPRRGDQAFLDRVLHPDFEEFGSSGRHWGRSELIRTLLAAPDLPEPQAHDFRAAPIGADAMLLTYRTSSALRSSVWLRTPAGWQLRFHQGTPLSSGRFQPPPPVA
ncbi:MAG TPA: DUF4440 domain-containing protein [Jatrophihabitans sp.]|nr:DUF4440 domain-containing protein [Jatrophihabitans sp.]